MQFPVEMDTGKIRRAFKNTYGTKQITVRAFTVHKESSLMHFYRMLLDNGNCQLHSIAPGTIKHACIEFGRTLKYGDK